MSISAAAGVEPTATQPAPTTTIRSSTIGQAPPTSYYVQPGTTSQMQPPQGPMIDEKIVQKQKEKALRELESRVKLALQQHEQMYQLQKSHIMADHDRQMEYTKATIEKERQAAMFDLEGQYQTNTRGLEQSAIQQRMQIETTAMQLDIQAHQQKMIMEHQEREKKWTGQPAVPQTLAVPQPYVAPTTYSAYGQPGASSVTTTYSTTVQRAPQTTSVEAPAAAAQ
ncbi:hypothetical protein Pmar_PMAR006130 [Perkinsus marinus ATCC 50983]|uniref:Uncharacterized protein n=2 Tax=Perkinsus marinus (strain ATCC 50983 / TXsc) TaxID=423536 RepID=C5LAA7_PERM5|nr:hypothetical protein Pmar_PMAR006130 [Perkinsus marinus ATCC 50983]EER06363.1 hypothetical protein Pmar_PMAR006130 [Perkinsus marinus ATCC 50983]|eukprot:XP_002774547.1 hypothetical protein Pmar_PMAR006130 [Perkinsus marinus ATCC 50983]